MGSESKNENTLLEEKNNELQEALKIAQNAVKKAEEANESKSRFLAQMSHEIRTPLNIIIGLVDLCKGELDDKEKMQDYLMKIEGSSKILLGIINDILDMSAIEGGKIQLEKRKFDLRQQITDVALMYYQQTKSKEIHFDVHLKGITEEFLIGDEMRVNQILLNLLSNAVKFTPANGQIILNVMQASTSRDRVHMRFSVSDTGCGMSEDLQSRLFKPFEQENESTARKYGGSGLGLSITKNLVEMMGGTIQVKSKLGEGSEFIVDIPFGRAEKSVKEKVAKAFSSYKAMIIADSKENCKERGKVLEDMGLEYDYSTDAEDALDRIGQAEEEGSPYRLCVVDWRVNSMTGAELIHEIRDIFGNGMVIIGAAFDLSSAMAEGKEAGANYMVCKPVFRSTLFDALMNLSKGQIDQYDSNCAGDSYDFSGRQILLAEDVALNMEVAVKLLKKTGVQVSCVENGKEAVEVFEKQPAGYFDCIFLDINMPVMDGYEAAKRIRESQKQDAKTVPIYAMTANAFTDDVSHALDVGMDGHIAKPIETDVLYKILATLFEEESK